MIVTCQECRTEYRLDPARLGGGGHDVRCTTCGHVWFQERVAEKNIEEVMDDHAVEEFNAVTPDLSFEENPEESFADLVEQVSAADPVSDIPEAVKPLAVEAAPAMVYRPMNMGPGQLGLFTFLTCCFVTLSLLFLLKAPIVHAAPAMQAFYAPLGLGVPVPGAGLRFQDLRAQSRVEDGKKDLSVEARLVNMTEEEITFPAVEVALLSAYDAVLKSWVMEPGDAKPLASGEAVPVKFRLDDVPDGGTDVEIKVARP